MEILILGLILVAAMVIVSTKIKRASAAAYQHEAIDKDEFRLQKPEGFLYPLIAETEFEYEAYSKTYGDRGTRNIWRARTRLRVTDGLNIRKIISEIKKSGETSLSEKVLNDLPDGQIGSIVRTDKEVDEVDYKVFRKIIADKSRKKTYELRSTVLCPFEEDLTDIICAMMHSFEVKS